MGVCNISLIISNKNPCKTFLYKTDKTMVVPIPDTENDIKCHLT